MPLGPMTSDIIGNLGELKFEELCRVAGLDVAKPVPDRTGKDRIVEWPPVEPFIGATFQTK